MKKSFLVIGAGAIGTYLGARLILQGHKVLFLERERDIPALEERGLHLTLGEDHYQLSQAVFTSSLAVLNKAKIDLAILALKTYHLEALVPDLVAYQDRLPPLLCLQNGVESEGRLSDALGSHAVIPGTVTSAVDRFEKGVVVLQKSRGMGIAGDDPRLDELKIVFDQAGLNCRVYRRAEAMKWSKLVINLLGNASSAILNLPPSEIYAHPDLYQIELDQILEALRVMRAKRIPTVNLPGVPVKILAAVVRSTPASFSQPILSKIIGGGRGEKMPSFHIDLYSGRGKSEVGELNGAVVRAGAALGIPTPVNEFLTSRLTAMVNQELPLDRYQNRTDLFLKDLISFQAGKQLSE